MKLYLLDGCPFAHRATIVLREKELAFEPIFFERGKRPPELEAAGPYAKSPTVFDGDAVVWDAQIVIEYLEQRYPERPLMPSSAAGQAEARMLMALTTQELGPPTFAAAVELVFKPTPDETKVAEAKSAFIAALPPWDARLAGSEFLQGDRLTLADVTLYTTCTSMFGVSGLEVPRELSHLRGWYERMRSRPTTPLLRRG